MGVTYREYMEQNKYYYRKPARSKVTTGSDFSGMYIGQTDLQRALKELDKVADRFADVKWRRQVLGDAAELVADAARKKQAKNDSKKEHFWYKNWTKGNKRARGEAMGNRIRVRSGNLRKSIQYLRNLRKTATAVIGPRLKTVKQLDKLKNLGLSPGNSSGHYAGMSQTAYSGADDFRRDIMEPALQKSASAVLAHLTRDIIKRKQKTTLQLRFWNE